MYAPAHVSTALAVKRAFPVAPLFGLMLVIGLDTGDRSAAMSADVAVGRMPAGRRHDDQRALLVSFDAQVGMGAAQVQKSRVFGEIRPTDAGTPGQGKAGGVSQTAAEGQTPYRARPSWEHHRSAG